MNSLIDQLAKRGIFNGRAGSVVAGKRLFGIPVAIIAGQATSVGGRIATLSGAKVISLGTRCGSLVTKWKSHKKILRFAMVWNHCFTDRRKGFVAYSAASRVLVDNPMARSGLGFMFDECWQAFAHTLDSIRDHRETENVAKTGWRRYHKTDQGLFEYHSSRSEMSRRMAEAMICFNSTVSVQSQASFLVKNYPWNTGTKVVDVGGAQGHVSIEPAQTYPNLKVVPQDLPDVVEGIEKTLPNNIKDRIETIAHDFFSDQIVQADAYLFSQIFHDWPEAHCIKILRALIPQLKPGARVICYNHLLPEPGTIPLLEEQAARSNGSTWGVDMIMLSLFNSRERDADDWVTLFQAADPRFGKPKAWIPERSNLGIIEAVWEGGSKGAQE
ncbi:hypothetical protein BHYA_0046g00290 [Botrytis hyacinthi]|uniref:O-methyltransferase C-terminal domain-containing protein n=1 Tax=Botrytis hyacinthi TaxID=278943 RepID=A0A4Z1GSY2_9HELO|nr:hypothetical protein BHYA_0046g00290 [Botrytis hyacinthi]